MCEYASRTNRHAIAFVLVGCLFRQVRLLALDTPDNGTESAPVSPKHEIENRIVWACYTLDVLLASGVDKNSSWRDDRPTIALPFADADFLSQTTARPPSLMYVLDNPRAVRELDLPALNVILIHLRSQVLRYG